MAGKVKQGYIECVECNGLGGVNVSDGTPDGEETVDCQDCNGTGVVKCEHWEEDHNICMDCGMDLTSDKIDEAQAQREDR